MIWLEGLSVTAMLLIFFLVIIPILIIIYLIIIDRKQKQHTILRNFPILGRMRYMLEKTGPELRQYLFDDDNDGKPFNREEYLHMVLPGKYLNSVIGFIDKIRDHSGKPVGIKVVIGGQEDAEELASFMHDTGLGPDFISLDGAEGGSGATYQDLADSVGLPLHSSIVHLDNALRKYDVRDQVKIIASGKITTPDRAAIVLGMGADLVQIARGFMISVGCVLWQNAVTPILARQVLPQRILNYNKGLL